MSLRGVQLPQFTYEAVKAQYHELFITTTTNIQDPNIRPSGGSQSRTFYILETGEYEGEEGFWVQDEEGAEGFCPLEDEESFCQLEDHDAFALQKLKRRTLRPGRAEKEEKEEARESADKAALTFSEKHRPAARLTWPMRSPPIKQTGERKAQRIRGKGPTKTFDTEHTTEV